MPKPIKKQVWNNVDAFGLLNGIATWDENYLNLKYVRIPGESNIELRHKLNKFSEEQNPLYGNIDQQLIIGLANELGLDSYNIMEQTSFDLNFVPYPYAPKGVQDIWVYYQSPNTDTWAEITPQLWSEDVENGIPNSGFIVWEDSYFNSSTDTTKENNYSRLLQVNSTIPNNSRIKVVYYREQINADDERVYLKFTDTVNPYDLDNDAFHFYKSDIVTSGTLLTNPVVYTLSEIPPQLSGFYYDINGKPKDLLFKIRDKVDSVYRHRWESIQDRQTIWDINLNFNKGSIPSFYDSEFTILSGEYEIITDNLTGGVNYYNSSMYLGDIDIMSSGTVDHWYPKLQAGPLYINGRNYYLMQNASGILINLSTGSTPLPSGIEIYHKIILEKTNIINTNQYIYKDFDYELDFYNLETMLSGTLDLQPTIARKRAYLKPNMGFDVVLNPDEYQIDYESGMIYSNGLTNCVLYYDDVIVPEMVTIKNKIFDLNPLNDTTIGFDEYFLVVGE